MKNKFIKKLALLLAAVLTITSGAIGLMAYAGDTGTVVCNIEDSFPDPLFKEIVKINYDLDEDGALSTTEINRVTSMTLSFLIEDYFDEMEELGINPSVNAAVIKDLTGIEYFTNLTRIRASSVGLETINVSSLTKLVELTVQGNELTSLDVSKNVNLTQLNCSANHIKSLDLSKNPSLKKIHAYANEISDIKFNSSIGETLTDLYIHQNELTSLDVSKFVNLNWFNCSHNHLSALDLSNNTKLLNITDAYIGDQTVEAEARLDNGIIYVSFEIPNYNQRLVSTSVDTVESNAELGTVTRIGYDGVDFTPQDCDDIVNGITYYYNTGLEDAESMDVHVDVLRDFWQVKFFTNENKTSLYKKELVFTGKNATAPTNIGTQQCKLFDGWSEDYTNVKEDKDIYAIWLDDHNITVQAYEGGIFYFNCTKCNAQESDYSFSFYVNINDKYEFFPTLLDQNNDGIINAKDYAILRNALKKS